MGKLMDLIAAPVARHIMANAGSGTANPAQWLVDMLGGRKTASGVRVNEDTAMRLATVYGCVNAIAQDISKLPLYLYRRTNNGAGRERVLAHPALDVVREPNAYQTGMEMRETLTFALSLRGNAYGWIIRDGRGRPTDIVPLEPGTVQLHKSPDGLFVAYSVTLPGGRPTWVRQADMLHLKGLSRDGYLGLSPIGYLRETVGLGMAAVDQGGRQFANDITPGLILESAPGFRFEDAHAAQNYRKAIQEQRTGENKFMPMITEHGFKVSQTQITPEDQQYIETQKFNRQQLAGAWRVPLHKLGDLENASLTNVEEQNLDYVNDCLLAHTTRWEERLDRTLLLPEEREIYFFEHDFAALLRGDTEKRWNAYGKAIQHGVMSPNEVRGREALNPYDRGDTYYVPLNMQTVDQAAQGMNRGGGRATPQPPESTP